jgi:hypothetical protein
MFIVVICEKCIERDAAKERSITLHEEIHFELKKDSMRLSAF